uniref:Secreted protein n=1 Tax=Parascaris univalens TaxID=6257 RepID=A0A915AGU8_PARUN
MRCMRLLLICSALLTLTAISKASLHIGELQRKRCFTESMRVDAYLLELLPVKGIVEAKKEPNCVGVLFTVTVCRFVYTKYLIAVIVACLSRVNTIRVVSCILFLGRSH